MTYQTLIRRDIVIVKVDANGTLRLKDLIDYLDTRIVDYAIPKKEIDEAKNDFNNTGSTRKIIQLKKKAENLFTRVYIE